MSAPRCVDCGTPISDARSARCGPCGQRERNRRPRGSPAACADCGRAVHDGRSTRCNRCEQMARKQRRANGREMGADLLVCPLDGLTVKAHRRCGICTALLGSAHAQRFASVTATGVAFCDSCERMIRRFDSRAMGVSA